MRRSRQYNYCVYFALIQQLVLFGGANGDEGAAEAQIQRQGQIPAERKAKTRLKTKRRKSIRRKAKSASTRPKRGTGTKTSARRKASARLKATAELGPGATRARRLAAPAAVPAPAPGPLDPLMQIAANSPIAKYSWLPNRGVAPSGYIKGMALVYARVYCKFKAGDAAAVDMSCRGMRRSSPGPA